MRGGLNKALRQEFACSIWKKRRKSVWLEQGNIVLERSGTSDDMRYRVESHVEP